MGEAKRRKTIVEAGAGRCRCAICELQRGIGHAVERYMAMREPDCPANVWNELVNVFVDELAATVLASVELTREPRLTFAKALERVGPGVETALRVKARQHAPALLTLPN